MSKKRETKKEIRKKLLHKYRLVILNEDTFEERFTIKLNRLNVFVITALSSIILIILTSILIAFTPLREYIPGYSSTALKKKATTLSYKADSLQQLISINERYYTSIRKVLTGDVSEVVFNRDSVINAANNDSSILSVLPSKEDSLLREKVNKEDKYSLFDNETSEANIILFPPVNGTISENYNLEDKHYAVDVVVPINTPVKAMADGTVIFSEWTIDNGFVIILEHNRELISVYKHNTSITKEQGEIVKAGEVIALSGSSGKLSTGPHLHFELWSKGYPVNPTNFIDFQ